MPDDDRRALQHRRQRPKDARRKSAARCNVNGWYRPLDAVSAGSPEDLVGRLDELAAVLGVVREDPEEGHAHRQTLEQV